MNDNSDVFELQILYGGGSKFGGPQLPCREDGMRPSLARAKMLRNLEPCDPYRHSPVNSKISNLYNPHDENFAMYEVQMGLLEVVMHVAAGSP